MLYIQICQHLKKRSEAPKSRILTTMKNAKILLKELTRRIPPAGGRRHSITLNGWGDMELTVFCNEQVYLMPLSDRELDIKPSNLVDEIESLMKPPDFS